MSAGPTVTKRIKVGEEFTLSSSKHSNTQSVAWHWDPSYFEAVSHIGTVTQDVTFRALKETPLSSYLEIVSVTSYIEPGTTSTGLRKDKDCWHIFVKNDNDGDDNNNDDETIDWDENAGEVYFQQEELNIDLGSSPYLIESYPVTIGFGYSWMSFDPKIASVEQYTNNGRYAYIRGVSAGSTKIKVTRRTNTGNSWAYLNVNVLDRTPSAVSLNARSLNLNYAQKETLKSTVYPETAYYTLSWRSSDENVVSVDQSGSIQANKEGTATITVKTQNGKSDFCEITVFDEKPTSMTLSPDSLSITLGKEKKLSAKMFPQNTYVKEISWSSSNPEIASVSSEGVVRGLKEGSCLITATSETELSATAIITILPLPTSVVLPTSIDVNLGYERQLYPQLEPKEAESNFSWSSSDLSVVSVSDGKIKGRKVGDAEIWVTTENGKRTSCKVHVKNVPDVLNYRNATIRCDAVETLFKRKFNTK